MKIPYMDERKRLLALHEEGGTIEDEREKALAPLRANLDDAARGEIMDIGKQKRLSGERSEKERPAREALIAANRVFDER